MIPATEIKLCDLADRIKEFNPIEIWVDNYLVWTDDVDLINTTKAQADYLLYLNQDQFRSTLARKDLVSSISFEIVMHHHSIVKIITKQLAEHLDKYANK